MEEALLMSSQSKKERVATHSNTNAMLSTHSQMNSAGVMTNPTTPDGPFKMKRGKRN